MKSILVGLAVVAVSTSGAWAAHKTHHAMKPKAAAAAPATTPIMWPGSDSKADHALYVRNQHDSGMKK